VEEGKIVKEIKEVRITGIVQKEVKVRVTAVGIRVEGCRAKGTKTISSHLEKNFSDVGTEFCYLRF